MRDIYLSSGHSNLRSKDVGAISPDGLQVEGDLTIEMKRLIKSNNSRIKIDHDSYILSESINYFKTLTKKNSLVIDLHFNSATSSAASGVEVIIPANYSNVELNLAKDAALLISNAMGIPLRKSKLGIAGVKTELDTHHGRLGWMKLIGENILIEFCFLSNKSDMEKYHTNKVLISKLLSKLFNEYSIEPNDKVILLDRYVIIKGDTLYIISNKTGISVDNLLLYNRLKLTSILNIGQVLKLNK